MQFWTIDPVPLGPAFNSLFEMRAAGAAGPAWQTNLSILYLRCVLQRPELFRELQEVDLSILYLRCA